MPKLSQRGRADMIECADTAETHLERLQSLVQDHIDAGSDRWRESDAGVEWQAAADAVDHALDAIRTARASVDQ